MAHSNQQAQGAKGATIAQKQPVVAQLQTKLQARNAVLIAQVQQLRATKNAARRQAAALAAQQAAVVAAQQQYQAAMAQLQWQHNNQVQQLQAQYNIAVPQPVAQKQAVAAGQSSHAPGSRKAIHALCKGVLLGVPKNDAIAQLVNVHGFASHTAKLYYIAPGTRHWH